MTEKLKKIAESKTFQRAILAVILLAAVLVGLETYPDVVAEHGELLDRLHRLVLGIFVVEALIKMGQYGRSWHRYFQDPWNVFDFSIVVVCFLPVGASYAAVLRLARIMRALRLITALPKLQLIVGALIRSIPSMGYVGVLLALNFYVYAVMGVFLFSENDPVHFKDLPTAMLSLFRVVTLEDWTDVMYINMYGVDSYPGLANYVNPTGITPDPATCPPTVVGVLYFASFVMLGTMIMLNLFIGVIINSMDEAKVERERELRAERLVLGEGLSLSDELEEVDLQIHAVRERLKELQVKIKAVT